MPSCTSICVLRYVCVCAQQCGGGRVCCAEVGAACLLQSTAARTVVLCAVLKSVTERACSAASATCCLLWACQGASASQQSAAQQSKVQRTVAVCPALCGVIHHSLNCSTMALHKRCQRSLESSVHHAPVVGVTNRSSGAAKSAALGHSRSCCGVVWVVCIGAVWDGLAGP